MKAWRRWGGGGVRFHSMRRRAPLPPCWDELLSWLLLCTVVRVSRRQADFNEESRQRGWCCAAAASEGRPPANNSAAVRLRMW